MARRIDDRQPSEAILNHRIDWNQWPAGLSYFQESDMKAFKYAVKYALKDMDCQVQRTHLSMSKKPPLGTEFFQQLARAHVEQGLAPQTANYSFRDIMHNGKRLKFQLQGRAREIYFDTYRFLWSITRGGPYPISEILETREDDLTYLEDRAFLEKLEKQRVKNPVIERLVPVQIRLGDKLNDASKIWRDPKTGAEIAQLNGGNIVITNGGQTWLVEPGKDVNFVATVDKILSQFPTSTSAHRRAREKLIRKNTPPPN